MRKYLAAGAVALGVLLTAPAAPALAQGPALPSGQQQACLGKPPASDPAVPWAQQQLAPQRAWTLTNGGGVLVGVVDTGVDANTPQLAGHVQAGTDVLNPGGGAGNSDCFGHGTFVAGIIAANPMDGTGFTGLAPGVQILPIRVANNADDVSAASIATGIRAAVDGGARVINVSASTTVQLPALQDAVAYAEARDVVLIASAANSAKDGDPVTYPASYPTVIAVGAIDSAGQRADFSQTGPYLGLVAPGVNVVSVGPGGPGQWQGSGTSYAAPFVTATAALIRAYRPGLSAAQVRHRLQVTADHPAAKLPDPELGWGTVNPVAAVSAVLPEESGDAGKTVKAEPARAPVVPPLDKVGPLLVVLGLFVALMLAFVLVLWRRIGPAGQRRQWRRGRVIRPVQPPSPDREQAPDRA